MTSHEIKILMSAFIRHRIMQLQFDPCAKVVANK